MDLAAVGRKCGALRPSVNCLRYGLITTNLSIHLMHYPSAWTFRPYPLLDRPNKTNPTGPSNAAGGPRQRSVHRKDPEPLDPELSATHQARTRSVAELGPDLGGVSICYKVALTWQKRPTRLEESLYSKRCVRLQITSPSLGLRRWALV